MTSLRKQLMTRLAKLGVEEQPVPGRDDGFAGLSYRGKEFAHFHDDDELDLHLTRSVIAREGLVHPSNSRKHPKRSTMSHWIELPLKTVPDLDHVTRLIELAIANMTP
jgi:hypothetical protein